MKEQKSQDLFRYLSKQKYEKAVPRHVLHDEEPPLSDFIIKGTFTVDPAQDLCHITGLIHPHFLILLIAVTIRTGIRTEG